MTMHSSEITVAVYVAILATIFAGALLALLIICGKFSCAICRINIAVNNPEKKKSFDLRLDDIHLISSQDFGETDSVDDFDRLAMEDLTIPDLDKLLESHHWKWVDDALGLVPHCLSILKGCRLMSEHIVLAAMASSDHKKFMEVAMVAKGVVPLVDEMLRCMCPPINPRLVENHAKALLQGVHGLVQLTQSTCGVQWPMLLLDEMNQHYQDLRDISQQHKFSSTFTEEVSYMGNVAFTETCVQ